MKIQYPTSRFGVSRVELLIFVAICTLIMAILWPSLETVREKARNYQCRSRLRSIGVALHSYHEAFQSLPPAGVWSRQHYPDLKLPRTVEFSYGNWAQVLLPHLNRLDVSRQFDQTLPAVDPKNERARMTFLAEMTCPLDTYNHSGNLGEYPLENGSIARFARGNYALNGGPRHFSDKPGYLWGMRPHGAYPRIDKATGDFRWYFGGIGGFSRSLRMEEVRNGASTTVAVDEIRAGIVPEDLRGVWALGQVGGSVTAAHGVWGDAGIPNSQFPAADDIWGAAEMYKKYRAERFRSAGMPCCDHCPENKQVAARSMHAGGVNLLTLDGAVHFVVNTIDPSIWHVMHSAEAPASTLAGEDLPARLSGVLLKHESKPRDGVSRVNSSVPLPNDLTNSLGMRFKQIIEGEYIMGLPDDRVDDPSNLDPIPDEVRTHPVKITKPFLFGIHEVTQDQFQQVMGYNPSWHSAEGEGRLTVDGVETGAFPVENVTWTEAAEFCQRLTALHEEKQAGRSYRIPWEAEWEYVCRSGKTTPYQLIRTWGVNDHLGEYAWKGRGTRPKEIMTPTPIGSYPPNEFGIHDMRGNVWEWCADYFARDYYGLSPKDDPTGPAEGILRVWRGSDWVFASNECKTHRSWSLEPWDRNPFLGFRVVCEITPQ